MIAVGKGGVIYEMERIGERIVEKSSDGRKAGRICLVLVSYLFLMVFLGCFFMTALYYYWFGGETVKTYRKTQRFEEKMMEKLEVMAPAVREYLRKGQYWEENEAVTVYYWKQNGAYLSYTNEEAVEKLGSFGGCRGMNDLTVSYDWQEKKFTFSELDSFYTNQWEAMFQKEFREKGTQCYLAVDRNVMQNWISYYGNLSWDLEPGDAKGIRCDYSLAGMKKEDSLCLFYSPGKDQWYYLIQYQENGKTREKQRAFELPKTVYFPLCYVTKRSANGKRILQNISSADFDNAVLFMDATKVFSKNAGVADNGGVILESSPFFNLKSILYEGCKCYYQGRALLSYLENRMDGYLWQVQFHSGDPWKIGRVEAVPKERKWKITVDNDSYYEEDVREEEPASLFGLNEYPYNKNVSLDIRLMIPEYSVRQVLFSEKTPEIRLNFSYFLEKKLFEKGRVKKNRYHGIELGLVSLAVWLFLFVKLAVSAKPSGFKKAVSIEAVAAADGAAAVAAALFCTCGDALPYWLDIAMKCACTLLYFLYYGSIAWIAASIRERSLWKNSLPVKPSLTMK